MQKIQEEKKEREVWQPVILDHPEREARVLMTSQVVMLVLPMLIMLLGMILLPIYLKVDVSGYLFAYVIYLLLATISIIFLNLLIGAVSDTQSKAQVYSMFPVFIVSFLPMIALQNDTVQKVLDYSFIGPIVNLLNKKGGEISFSNIGMLLAWVLVLGIANLFVLKNSYKAR